MTKRTDEVKAKTVLSIRLSVAMLKRIERAAAAEHMSRADWVRDALLDAVRLTERRKAS